MCNDCHSGALLSLQRLKGHAVYIVYIDGGWRDERLFVDLHFLPKHLREEELVKTNTIVSHRSFLVSLFSKNINV